MDITGTTADTSDVTAGEVFFGADGTEQEGTLEIYNGLDKTTTGSALDAYQGKVIQDEIDDITIISRGNATINSTYIDSTANNTLSYRRQDDVVTVFLSFKIATATSDTTVNLATEFPATVAIQDYVVLDTTQAKPILVGVSTAGYLRLRWGSVAAGDWVRGCFTYVALKS